jgi:predicted nucleic acid-binding protein
MARLFFADNTVLVNFALLGRMALLRHLANGRAAWTAAVRRECAASAEALDNDELRCAHLVFGDPVRAEDPKTARELLVILDRLRDPLDGPEKHRGEAETIALISVEHAGSLFVTDDASARSEAHQQGISTVSTCQLLRLAVRVRALSAQDAWEAVCDLRRRGRTLHDSPRDQPGYMAWCVAA